MGKRTGASQTISEGTGASWETRADGGRWEDGHSGLIGGEGSVGGLTRGGVFGRGAVWSPGFGQRVGNAL